MKLATYWFIKKRPDGSWSRSSSCTVVTDLYSHLTRTQSAYSSTSKTNIKYNAKSGDVIQFKKDGADRYSHAMWIHTKTSSDLQLSGHTNTLYQTMIPRDKLGRVLSLVSMLLSTSVPLGQLFGSIVIGKLSISNVLIVFGVIVTISALSLFKITNKEEYTGRNKKSVGL